MMLRPLFAAVALWAASTPALAEWQSAKTRHFIIYADESPAELRDYALRLEQFDQAVRSARNMADPPLTDTGRLTIYVFKDVAAFSRLLETSEGIFGLYGTRDSGAYAFVAKAKPHGPGEIDSDIVFFHEYAHHLMLQDSSSYYPPWLVEGFAEFLSTAVIDSNGKVTLGSAANHRSAGVYAPDHDLPVSALVGDSYRSLNGWQWELLYSRGWLLTHYLTFEPSRKGQLDLYISGIQSGKTPLESAKAAFGDLLKLDRDLDEYARRKSLSAIVVQTDPSKIGAIEIHPLAEAKAAVLPVQMQLAFGVSRATADRVAGQARRIAARFPNDATVLATLAQAEDEARDYSAASAAADRAIALDPTNIHALIYKGRALMDAGKASPDSADWDAIRGWFARANHVDPEDAEPLMLFYTTYKESGAAPTESAIKGILYALVLSPQNRKLRLLAVRQLLLDRRLAEAKADFAPLASDPHTRDFHDTAEDILQAMNSGDSTKALTLLDSWQAKNEKDDD